MTDHQVTLVAAALSASVPTLAVLVAMVSNNRQIDSLRREIDVRFSALDKTLDARFSEAQAGLLRVEGVLDARLRHLEER